MTVIVILSIIPLMFSITVRVTWGIFHKATNPVMTGENTGQNDINDWSLFHRTASDKQLVKCNKVIGKFELFDKCLFHKDIFLSQALVIV